jgi:hypothetical protein
MFRFPARTGQRTCNHRDLNNHPWLELLEERALLSIAGPDGFGYTAAQVPVANINLQMGQPGVFTILQGADDAFAAVNLGTDTFNFYGKTYTGANAIFVSTKGLITFGAGDLAYQNTDLTTNPTLPTIAPLWADYFNNNFRINQPEILGQFVAGPNGSDTSLIIEWNQVGAWKQISAPNITFEAILQLNAGGNTSSITFNYSTLNATTSAIATAGIKDGGGQGANRILISQNALSPYIGNGLAIQFTAPPFGSTISGQVYDDLNNNGVHDAGEPGMAGVTVYLDLNRDGRLDPGDPTAVTDSNGNYSFANVPAGSFQVEEVLPAGWSQTSPSGTFTTPTVGPDGFGYSAWSTPIQNIDLEPNQPGVFTILQSGDNVSVPVNLGTNSFNFYGTTYTGATSLYVSDNGMISFGVPDVGWTNGDLSTYPPEPAITPFWSDWFKFGTDPAILGKFVTNSSGVPVELIVEWHKVNVTPASPGPITFQAILQLNTGAHPGTMEFDYPNLIAGNPVVDNGANATVGLENSLANASDRLLISENNGSGPLVGTGKAILVSAAAGGAYDVALGFRATAAGNDFGNFHAITAVNDAYSTNENQPLNVVAPGVLANDTGSVPGAPLSAALITSVSNGALTFHSDGSFSYTPAANFVGTDSFTYTASNGGPNSNVGTVTLTVNPVASPPILMAANTSGLDGAAIPLSISAAPSDTNFQEVVSVQITGLPTGVSLSAGTNTGGGVWLLSPAQLQGLTLFSSAPGTFSLTVTATATAVADGSQASASTTINVLVNDAGPSNLNLNVSAPVINENDSTTLSGTFVDPGTPDTHTVLVNWGDGSTSTLQLAAGVTSFGNLAHQYLQSPPGMPSGIYPIQVTVTDNFGVATSATTGVTVNDIPPTDLTLVLSATNVNEGDSTSLSGTFADPGTLATYVIAVSWGDGASSTVNLPAGVRRFTGLLHKYLDSPGNYALSVTVTDNYGKSTTATGGVQVLNIAPATPTLTLAATTVNENGSISLGGSFLDAGLPDTHTVVVNWGDGGSSTVNLATGVLTFSGVTHQYADNPGSYPITVTITDEDGGSTSATAAVQVVNVPPANLGLALTATTINENGSTSLSGSFTDAGLPDTHTVVVNWGDGGSSTVNLASGVFTFSGVSHQYADNPGSYAITVTVGDANGGSTSATAGLQVLNVPPTNLTLALTATTVTEAGSTSLGGSFTDAGLPDTHTLLVNWGDGGSSTVNLASGVLTFSGVTHQYLDSPASGSYSVSVTVIDGNGGSTSAGTSVVVNNVVPFNIGLSLSAAVINENDSTGLSGTFSDPGTLDTHTVVVNWGDGSSPVSLNLAAGVLAFGGITHQYLDNPPGGAPGYTISVTVSDEDGGSASTTTSVQVVNVAPSNLALALSSATINENASTSLSGSFADPGTLDTHTVVVNWGDGGSSTVNLAAGVTTFGGLSHQYLDNPAGAPNGSYAITVSVTDKDGGATSAATSVTVQNVAPANLSLALSAAVINQGGSTALSGGFTDAGTLDTHVVSINWGDGNQSTLNLAAGVLSFGGANHQYVAAAGTYTVAVTVTDNDLASVTGTTTVQVNGSDDDKIKGPKKGVRGEDLAFQLDPGTALTSQASLSYTIDWNDNGRYVQNVKGAPGLTVHHVFTNSGAHTIHVTATNQAGVSSDLGTLTVTVTAAALESDPLYPGLTALVVGGTMGDDTIAFTLGHKSGEIQVSLNGQDLGTFAPTSRIIAFGQAGNDLIEVSRHIKLPAWLYGGAGDDVLIGGGGNNVLVGGDGNNMLVAGAGRDILIGGSGNSVLIGKGKGDILIAGTTAFDNSEAALFAIQQEWTSNHDYETRVANLSGSNRSKDFGKRLNGDYFLKLSGSQATVFADKGGDIVMDRDGKDWEVIPDEKGEHSHRSEKQEKAVVAFWNHIAGSNHWQDEWKDILALLKHD